MTNCLKSFKRKPTIATRRTRLFLGSVAESLTLQRAVFYFRTIRKHATLPLATTLCFVFLSTSFHSTASACAASGWSSTSDACMSSRAMDDSETQESRVSTVHRCRAPSPKIPSTDLSLASWRVAAGRQMASLMDSCTEWTRLTHLLSNS